MENEGKLWKQELLYLQEKRTDLVFCRCLSLLSIQDNIERGFWLSTGNASQSDWKLLAQEKQKVRQTVYTFVLNWQVTNIDPQH